MRMLSEYKREMLYKLIVGKHPYNLGVNLILHVIYVLSY